MDNNNNINTNNENIDSKSNHINNNNFYMGNIKLKYGPELLGTFFEIFSFLNIYDICNFVSSYKRLAIVNCKDYAILKIVLKIKNLILFSDIR